MKKRKDSFFGIHYDFHALPGQVVGEIYRPDIVARALDEIKPDFVQCDTKGHRGLSSYPTEVGTRAELADGVDVLKMWRDLTKERDIALYGHHSGLYEIEVAKNHPDWAIYDENGIKNESYLSPFSPYADEYLIPQLKELAGKYGLNGAWVDGECWGSYVDYGPYATQKWKTERGTEPPKSSDDTYEEYREFCRQGFRDYISHYIAEIKKDYPDFEITSNWCYSSYMPEKMELPIDFISGDYNSEQSVESARINGRSIAARGKTWDLIAWGQQARPCSWITRNRSTKEYVQHCQEAAQILALGGAFVFFNIMYGYGGTVQEWMIPTWKRVAEFVREREPFCFGAAPVHEIGVIFPDERTKTNTQQLYNTDYEGYRGAGGWVNAIQDSQLSCEILMSSDFGWKNLAEYPVIVMPWVEKLDDNAARKLRCYVEAGGKLIIEGAAGDYFEDITGDTTVSSGTELIFLSDGKRLAAIETECNKIKTAAESIGNCFADNLYTEQKPFPAAFLKRLGKGTVVMLPFTFGKAYETNRTPVIRRFMKNIFECISYVPKVTVTGSVFADVTVMKKQEKLHVNLLNYAGTHNDVNYRTYDEIPPIGPLEVIVRDTDAKSVTMQPGGISLPIVREGRTISVKVEKLDIHSILVVE